MKATVYLVLLVGLAAAPIRAQTPQFVGVWLGGPLDSLYNAEYARVQEACRGAGEACYAQELDTTAVRLAPVWAIPRASQPAGWLVARLRPRGAFPYATLLFAGPDGTQVPLIEDLGDWGYGMTLDLVEARDGWLRPWILQATAAPWISPEGGPGFGILEGPFGLEGRLWRRVAAAAISDGLPDGVFMVLAVSDGVVRYRAELPSDMDCGEPLPGTPVPAVSPREVPLTRLLDALGRPLVELAYPRGC